MTFITREIFNIKGLLTVVFILIVCLVCVGIGGHSLDLSKNPKDSWNSKYWLQRNENLQTMLESYKGKLDLIKSYELKIRAVKTKLAVIKAMVERLPDPWPDKTFNEILEYLNEILSNHEGKGADLLSIEMYNPNEITMLFRPGSGKDIEEISFPKTIKSVEIKEKEDGKQTRYGNRMRPVERIPGTRDVIIHVKINKYLSINMKELTENSEATLEYIGTVDGNKQWRILPSDGIGKR